MYLCIYVILKLMTVCWMHFHLPQFCWLEHFCQGFVLTFWSWIPLCLTTNRSIEFNFSIREPEKKNSFQGLASGPIVRLFFFWNNSTSHSPWWHRRLRTRWRFQHLTTSLKNMLVIVDHHSIFRDIKKNKTNKHQPEWLGFLGHNNYVF